MCLLERPGSLPATGTRGAEARDAELPTELLTPTAERSRASFPSGAVQSSLWEQASHDLPW